MLEIPSEASLQGLNLFLSAKIKGMVDVPWQRRLPWDYKRIFRGSRASLHTLAMIVSPDAISLRYCFSQKSPALLSAAALLQARSTPETLQLPPRPAASLPRYGGLLLWPTLVPKMCCAAQQTSEYPLSCGFPRGRSYLSVTSLSGSLTIFSLSFLLLT